MGKDAAQKWVDDLDEHNDELSADVMGAKTLAVEDDLADYEVTEEMRGTEHANKKRRSKQRARHAENDAEDIAAELGAEKRRKGNPKNAMFDGTRWEHSGVITKFWHRHMIAMSVLLSVVMLAVGMTVGVASATMVIQDGIQQALDQAQTQMQQEPSWQGYYLSSDLEDVDVENGVIRLQDGRTFQIQDGWTIAEVEDYVPAVVVQNDQGDQAICMMVDCDDLSTFSDLELIHSDDGTNTVISAFQATDNGDPLPNPEQYIQYLGKQ